MRWVKTLVIGLFAACGGNANFKLPEDFKGGFVVRCVGITDFAAPRGQTPQCIHAESSMGGIDPMQDGACACAGGRPPLPPLTNDPFAPNEATRRSTELAGAAAFGDSFCHTIVADTCIPMAVKTDPTFHDTPATTPVGYVNSFWYATVPQRGLDHVTQPMERDFPELMNSPAAITQATLDTYRAFREGCNLAQWNVLTQELYQYPPFSLEWASQIDMVGAEYNNKTTHLNGQNLNSDVWARWPFNTPGGLFLYATHKYRPLDNIGGFGAPVPTPCNQGMVAPWGKAAVKDFGFPAFVANVPPPKSHVAGRVAPVESVVISSSSAALLTLSTGDDPVPVSFTGAIDLSKTNCHDGACQASLSLTINTTGFKVHGYEVSALELRSSASTTGVIQDDTLAFSTFSGSLYARLADGRYDQAPITTGAVLARWNPTLNQFVMAFNFDAELDGVTATLGGTAFGTFVNTSPAARIAVTSPASTASNGVTHAECTGPSGTTVVLDGSSSSDLQDAELAHVWYSSDASLATTPQVTFPSLALGSGKDVILMAYDSRGAGGEDRIVFDVVDTLAPSLEVSNACVFPPNHKDVCLRLFHELPAVAIDQCDGGVADSIKIVNVTADNNNNSILSWDEDKVCVTVERDGHGSDLVDHVVVEATDSSGNVVQKTIALTIPHDMRAHKRCLNTNHLTGAP